MELLFRPTEDFLLKASLQDLKESSRLWLTELKNCKKELDFFIQLIDVFFPQPSMSKLRLEKNHIINRIYYFNHEDSSILLKNVELHEFFLGELIKDSIALSNDVYREEHKKVEWEILKFMKEYKVLKSEFMHFIQEAHIKSALQINTKRKTEL